MGLRTLKMEKQLQDLQDAAHAGWPADVRDYTVRMARYLYWQAPKYPSRKALQADIDLLQATVIAYLNQRR